MNPPAPRFVVGLHADRHPPKYYLCYHDFSDDGNCAHVRHLLEARLNELDAQANALRDILATSDPERAEHLLCDGPHVAVSEVTLRAQRGRAAIAELVEHKWAGKTRGRA